MSTLDDLNSRLEALRLARSSGVRAVEFQNGEHRQHVEYKTDAEMAAAIAAIESEIAGASGARVRNVIVRNSGGW